MLQVTVHNTQYPYVFTKSLAGHQTANAPDDQIDLNPRLTRLIQLIDQRLVLHSVHLQKNVALLTLPGQLNLPVDTTEQLMLKIKLRHQQLPEHRDNLLILKILKQLLQIKDVLLLTGKKTMIGILPRRFLIKITRTQVRIRALSYPATAPNHQGHLRMHL